MPKIYSEVEKAHIRASLIKEAKYALSSVGVKRTTVDDLVQRVHIPKGTFYLFYPSKEALFYDVLVSFRREAEEGYLAMLQELDENKIVTSLTRVFSTMVMKIYHEGLYRFLDEGQLDLVLRKIPDEQRMEEENFLRGDVERILAFFSIDDKSDIKRFEGCLIGIIYMLPSARNIPDFEKAVSTLLRGLVLQLVGE